MSVICISPTTQSRYVLSLAGGVDPNLEGPFADADEQTTVFTRLYAGADPDTDVAFLLYVADDATVSVVAPDGALADTIDEFAHGPYCLACEELTGPDYHVAGTVTGMDNDFLCPFCWDPRLA